MGLHQALQTGLGTQGGRRALLRARSSRGGGRESRVSPSGPKKLLGPPVQGWPGPTPSE